MYVQFCTHRRILIGMYGSILYIMFNVITEAVCRVFMSINIHAYSVCQKAKSHQKKQCLLKWIIHASSNNGLSKKKLEVCHSFIHYI